jgi:hypothetical protein
MATVWQHTRLLGEGRRARSNHRVLEAYRAKPWADGTYVRRNATRFFEDEERRNSTVSRGTGPETSHRDGD